MAGDRGGVQNGGQAERVEMRRRDFLAAGAIGVAAIGVPSWVVAETEKDIPLLAPFFNMHGSSGADAQDGAPAESRGEMYGMIGKITTVSGKREEFIAILLNGIGEMPGCLSYVVAKDTSDANAIWVSEVWDSKASHDASLSLQSVKDAIAKGRPLIAGFSNNVVTAPVGGVGLPKHG